MSSELKRRATISGRTAIAAGFYILLAVFLVAFLDGVEWSQLAALSLQPFFLILALPVSLTTLLLQPLGWTVLLRDYGEEPPPYSHWSQVYAKSWLGRYIPGKVAWIGGKVLFGSRYGLRKGSLAVTSIVEAGIQLLTALGLGFLLFAVAGGGGRVTPQVRLFAALSFMVMIVALSPPVFNFVVSRVHRLVKGSPLRTELHLSSGAFVRTVLLYVVIQALGVLSAFLVLKAVHPSLTLGLLPYVGAVSLIAGALGTLAVFVPSGLGVREGILIVLLAVVIPKEIAVIAVVLMRLWSVAMDFAFFGVTKMLSFSART